MAKKIITKVPRRCAACVHETACKMWTDGREIADASASRCPNYETVRMSASYLIGKLSGSDETARKIFLDINEIKDQYADGKIDGDTMHICLYLLEKKWVKGE